MRTDGNLVETNEVSVADILKKYPVAPEGMDVNMHMISGMRGITEHFTVMARLPYYFKSMTIARDAKLGYTMQLGSGTGVILMARALTSGRETAWISSPVSPGTWIRGRSQETGCLF